MKKISLIVTRVGSSMRAILSALYVLLILSLASTLPVIRHERTEAVATD